MVVVAVCDERVSGTLAVEAGKEQGIFGNLLEVAHT
jgi:hypothetical protein